MPSVSWKQKQRSPPSPNSGPRPKIPHQANENADWILLYIPDRIQKANRIHGLLNNTKYFRGN